MPTVELRIRTGSRLVSNLTSEAQRFCQGRGDGLLNVFVPHATAGVAIMEAGSGSEEDLGAALERLLPVADIYRHRHGSLGHGRDHVLPAFVAPSVVLPVLNGSPALGTWQSLVLVDSNGDNPMRTVRMSFLSAS
jgi:secondary thiamine-phosphate synthase enzyme